MKKPSKDFSRRYASAKRFRDDARYFIEEALKYCAPGREFDFDNDLKKPEVSPIFSTIGMELAGDLGGDLVSYYVPAESRWVTYEFLIPVEASQEKQVLAEVQAREDTLFDILASSNFYDEAPKWALETAIHGTPAIWIERAHFSQPIFYETVPPHELLITPGHLGHLDRFREKTVNAEFLPALFDPLGDQVKLDDPSIKMLIEKASSVKVCWGFWLDWSDPGNPMWKSEITVNGHCVTYNGPMTLGPLAGSCPLVVGRFNPQSSDPWGRGAGWQATPDLRTMDAMAEMTLSATEQSLLPTYIYSTDGQLDLSRGIIAGTATPAGKNFTREQFVDLSRSVDVTQGWFSEDRLEERLRRAFFQDGPRQRGDTPPTAAQWVDERRRVQQRLGKPSAPIWSELIVPLIQRTEKLAVDAGLMPDAITHNGKVINVKPVSPLQKAQNQDQVMTAQANLGMFAQVFGESLPQVIDLMATAENVVRTSGDKLTVIAKPQEQATATPTGP